MNQPLKNKVAIVTGAGRGVGRALANAFARAGAAVACAARSQAELDDVVKTIVADGGRAITYGRPRAVR